MHSRRGADPPLRYQPARPAPAARLLPRFHDARTNKPTAAVPLSCERNLSVAWSLDGLSLVVACSSDDLVVVDTRKMRKQKQWAVQGHVKVGGAMGGAGARQGGGAGWWLGGAVEGHGRADVMVLARPKHMAARGPSPPVFLDLRRPAASAATLPIGTFPAAARGALGAHPGARDDGAGRRQRAHQPAAAPGQPAVAAAGARQPRQLHRLLAGLQVRRAGACRGAALFPGSLPGSGGNTRVAGTWHVASVECKRASTG